MTNKTIRLNDLAAGWQKDPEFTTAYSALADEFALAEALLQARASARLTQAEVAARMGTTQATIARIESGRSLPSTRTLQRYAAATGTRLEIRFRRDPMAPDPAE